MAGGTHTGQPQGGPRPAICPPAQGAFPFAPSLPETRATPHPRHASGRKASVSLKLRETNTNKLQSSQIEPSDWENSSPPPPTFLLEFLHTQGGLTYLPPRHTHTPHVTYTHHSTHTPHTLHITYTPHHTHTTHITHHVHTPPTHHTHRHITYTTHHIHTPHHTHTTHTPHTHNTSHTPHIT